MVLYKYGNHQKKDHNHNHHHNNKIIKPKLKEEYKKDNTETSLDELGKLVSKHKNANGKTIEIWKIKL